MLQKPLQKKVPPRWLSSASFAIRIVLAYGIWKAAYYWLETNLPPFWTSLQNFVAAHVVGAAARLLQFLGEEVIYNSRNVIVKGSEGIFLADHCIGIPAFVVFSIFILFYSGKWYHKIWFVPMGALSIFLMNIIRTSALAFSLRHYSKAYFNLSHNYIYLASVYGIIFLLIVWWMEKFDDATHAPITTPS